MKSLILSTSNLCGIKLQASKERRSDFLLVLFLRDAKVNYLLLCCKWIEKEAFCLSIGFCSSKCITPVRSTCHRTLLCPYLTFSEILVF